MSTPGRWIVLPLLLALSSTRADDWRWAGPLRYPSAHPFQSIFLETPALDPVLPAKGTLDLRLGHYNTQTVSTNTYFTPAGQALLLNTAQGRPQTPLAAASLAATARTRPDQTYLFADTETTRLDLTWLQPLAPGWGVQVEVPFLGHHGGVFDPVIEGFHGAFNFPTLGRNDAPHNRTQLFVARGDDSRFYDGPFEPGVGDLVVRGLRAVPEGRHDPAVMLSAALKLPTGAPSRFYGSGGWDWGLGLHLARTMAAFRLTFTAGHNWHAGWTGLASVPIRNTFDFHLGGEYRLARAWSFLAQVSRQEHALWEADRSSFGKPSYQIAAGFAYQRDPDLLLEGAFFENLTEDRNGFDVGLHYRMRWQL